MITVRDTAQGATFAVKVHPRARKTAITGVLGEGDSAVLKVSLSTPPVDGRANEALIEFFSEFFSVPRSAVAIVSGEHSRTKVLRITAAAAAIQQRIVSSL